MRSNVATSSVEWIGPELGQADWPLSGPVVEGPRKDRASAERQSGGAARTGDPGERVDWIGNPGRSIGSTRALRHRGAPGGPIGIESDRESGPIDTNEKLS